MAAALATAERDSTTKARIAACLFAAPPTSAPSVETLDARPKQETRPAGRRTLIAGREARMHERKGLAGQGGHAPPGTSAALKRRLYLGRPKTGATAGSQALVSPERWKGAGSPCRQRRTPERTPKQRDRRGRPATSARSADRRHERQPQRTEGRGTNPSAPRPEGRKDERTGRRASCRAQKRTGAAARGRGFAVSRPGCPLSRVFRVVVG